LAAGLLLAPTLVVPELALVPRPSAARLRGIAAVAAAGALVGAATWFPPFSEAATVVWLVAIAIASGAEFRVDPRRPIPVVAAALAVTVALVGTRDDFTGAIVVAIAATVSAGWFARVLDWRSPVLAGFAACVGVAVYDTRPSAGAAVAAVFAFELFILTRPSRVVWSAPVVGTVVLLAQSWRAIGPGGVLVFTAGLVVTAAIAGAFGALPWASRIVGAWTARRSVTFRVAVWGLSVAGASASAMVGFLFSTTRPVVVPLGGAVASAFTAMVLVAVRQWRFEPRRRALDASLVLMAAGAVALVYPPLALDGHGGALPVLTLALLVSSLVAWPLALLAISARSNDAARVDDKRVRVH
jgi:hypothetical protein